jgi:hypothetical protein
MNILAKFGSNGLNAFRKEDRNVKKLQCMIENYRETYHNTTSLGPALVFAIDRYSVYTG